jgi:putative CocE/NonD family hydrolase
MDSGSDLTPTWRLPSRKPSPAPTLDWIPMPDGKRLSLRLWLPTLELGERTPVVFEYIPYRKQDGYRAHDDAWGATLAGYGIGYARVDVRGSGDSEGVLMDEYLSQELEDGCACIAWLASRSWCNGRVGMRGLSWGGINTLQIAALRPPALRAIMPMGCLDNRYTDDAHYIGGALGHTNFQWGIGFKAVMAGPPDPMVVGEAWEAMWRERLEAAPPVLQTWLEHQRCDEYWRHGSIAEDWRAIEVPTYVVAGWQDTYSNPVGRLLQNLKIPSKALIGPWGHTYPWSARPQALDWAWEEVRWWEHWLKDADTGIMDEPRVRVFMPHAAPSSALPEPIPGRWVAESIWPPQTTPKSLFLAPDGLVDDAPPEQVVTYSSNRVVGLCKPEWLDRPPVEQTADNARSLMFETAPLADDLEILGAPVLSVRVSADQPVAKLAARLLEITDDGRSWLVTTGLLNLTHRASHTDPRPLVAGEPVDVEVTLSLSAHRFRAGSRIAVALSESLWPLVWPSPAIARLSFTLGEACRLTLPVRPIEAVAEPMPIPQVLFPVSPQALAPYTVTEPVTPGHYRLVLDSPPTPVTIAATGTTTSRGRWETSEIREADPNSCVWTHRALSGWTRGDWDCQVEATCRLTSTATEFHLTEGLTARLGGETIFTRETSVSVPRDLL